MPVIRLTDELYKFLLTHPDRNFCSEDTEPLRNLLRQYTEIGPDGKPLSFWYLDYLSVVVESLGWETSAAQRQKCLQPHARKEIVFARSDTEQTSETGLGTMLE